MTKHTSDPKLTPTEHPDVPRMDVQRIIRRLDLNLQNLVQKFELSPGEILQPHSGETYLVLRGVLHVQARHHVPGRGRVWETFFEWRPGSFAFPEGGAAQQSKITDDIQVIAESEVTVLPVTAEEIQKHPAVLEDLMRSVLHESRELRRANCELLRASDLYAELTELAHHCSLKIAAVKKPYTVRDLVMDLFDSVKARLRLEKTVEDLQGALATERETNRTAFEVIEGERIHLETATEHLRFLLGLIRQAEQKKGEGADTTILERIAQVEEGLNQSLQTLSLPPKTGDQSTKNAGEDRITAIPGDFIGNEPPSIVKPIVAPSPSGEPSVSDTQRFTAFDVPVAYEDSPTSGNTMRPPHGAPPPTDEVDELLSSSRSNNEPHASVRMPSLHEE